MIEMISIGNWVYLKQQLLMHYNAYLGSTDSEGMKSFKSFVEDILNNILKWNQYSMDDGIYLNAISNDDELALDIIEALDLADIEEIRSQDYYVSVSYIDVIGAAIVEAYPKGDVEFTSVNNEAYRKRIEELRLNKLTILARLLDVLRLSKSR